jgi:hypothetical protein
VQWTGRRLVGELADGGGDPAPDDRAIVIILSGELPGTGGAFLERLVAVALEHQVGRAPDVDIGYHSGKNHRPMVNERLTPLIAWVVKLRVKVAAGAKKIGLRCPAAVTGIVDSF